MAFSPDIFKKAMGGAGAPPPMGGAKPPAGDMGSDMEGLMGPPGGAGEIGELGDSEAEEGSEGSLEAALEQAGFKASPDQINQIKSILGVAGGMLPEGGSTVEEPGASALAAPSKPMSKLGKMFAGK